MFTRNLQTAFRANRELEVGGVIVGDVPSLPRRPDALRRRQGLRRRPRGLRSAMADFTYEKVMVLTGLTSELSRVSVADGSLSLTAFSDDAAGRPGSPGSDSRFRAAPAAA